MFDRNTFLNIRYLTIIVCKFSCVWRVIRDITYEFRSIRISDSTITMHTIVHKLTFVRMTILSSHSPTPYKLTFNECTCFGRAIFVRKSTFPFANTHFILTNIGGFILPINIFNSCSISIGFSSFRRTFPSE